MESITTQDLKQLLATKEIHLLDVREEDEYAESHIHQAQLVPLSSFPDVLTSLDAKEKYYLICRSGRRSKQAGMIMEFNNFNDVTNVEGGMLAWENNQ